MSRRHLTIVLMGLALAGPAWAQTGTETVPETETGCGDAGGRWERGGLAGQFVCFLPTPDAGQACATADDCAGFCLAGTGRCSAETPMFGCFAIADLDGAEVTLCID